MRKTKTGWGGGNGGRRVLLDLGRDDDESTRSSARLDSEPYEEESVFIPHAAAHAHGLAAAAASHPTHTLAASSSSRPSAAPAVVPSSSPSSAEPSGLAVLAGYGSSSDDDEDTQAQPQTQATSSPVASSTAVTALVATGASAASPPPLPPGWTACVEEASGDTYYWNETTNETTWDRPAPSAATAASENSSVSPSPSSAAAVDAADAAAPVLQGEAPADSPAVVTEEKSQPSTAAAAAHMVEDLDGEELEDDADDSSSDSSDDDDPSAVHGPARPPAPLPPGWKEVGDPSGSTYYWHESSGRTTWDRPAPSPTDDDDEQPSATGVTALEEEEEGQFAQLKQQAEKAIQEDKERESAAAAAASTGTGTGVVADSPQSMLINALHAGLQARLRPLLSRPVASIPSAPLQSTLSPLLRFHVALETRMHDWADATPEERALMQERVLRSLTQATVDIDAVIREEADWRRDRQEEMQKLQYEQWQQQQQQQQQMQQQQPHPFYGAMHHAFPAGAAALGPIAPPHLQPQVPPQPQSQSVAVSGAAAVSVAPPAPAPAPAPAPPAVSGFVHPSRLGVVEPVVVGRAAPTSAGGSAAPPPAPPGGPPRKPKRHRSPVAAGGSGGSGGKHRRGKKKKKSEVAAETAANLARMGPAGALVSKWTAVAAASQQADRAASRERKQPKWKEKDDPNNANLIPIGDWRSRVAAVKAAQRDE